MTKTKTTLTAAILAALLLVALAAETASAATVGISDQQSSTFTNPLFAPLKMKVARYITPYDVMSDSTERAKLDAWMTNARAARQRILVSFEHSRKSGRSGKV